MKIARFPEQRLSRSGEKNIHRKENRCRKEKVLSQEGKKWTQRWIPKKKTSFETNRDKKNQMEWRKKDVQTNNQNTDFTWKKEKVGKNKNIAKMEVAVLKDMERSSIIQQHVEEMGLRGVQVRPFGAKEKNMNFQSEEDCQEFINQSKGEVRDFFETVEPIDSSRVPNRFLVWLKLWKVPIGFWNVDFFSKVTSSIGSFVCMDPQTSKETRYDYARILLLSSDPLLENVKISINVENKEMEVLIDFDKPFLEYPLEEDHGRSDFVLYENCSPEKSWVEDSIADVSPEMVGKLTHENVGGDSLEVGGS